MGRDFEKVENPLKVGVLQSQKCYFIVFYKGGKAAIMLWRGKDQTSLDFRQSVHLFKKTKFRLDKNTNRGKGQRSKSNASNMSAMIKNNFAASRDNDDSPSLEEVGKNMSMSENPATTGIGSLGIDLTDAKRKSESGI